MAANNFAFSHNIPISHYHGHEQEDPLKTLDPFFFCFACTLEQNSATGPIEESFPEPSPSLTPTNQPLSIEPTCIEPSSPPTPAPTATPGPFLPATKPTRRAVAPSSHPTTAVPLASHEPMKTTPAPTPLPKVVLTPSNVDLTLEPTAMETTGAARAGEEGSAQPVGCRNVGSTPTPVPAPEAPMCAPTPEPNPKSAVELTLSPTPSFAPTPPPTSMPPAGTGATEVDAMVGNLTGVG